MKRAIECAFEFGLSVCESEACRCVHIELYDRDRQMFANATIAVENVPEFIEALKDLAYEAATKEPSSG